MKRYIPIAAVTLLVMAASGAGYYIYTILTSTFVTTAIDITDPTKIHVDIPELISFYKGKSALWGQTDTELQRISQLQYNEVYHTTLPAQFPLISNPNERKAQADAFYKEITGHVQSIISADKELGQSSIYSPIVRQLNLLSTEKAHFRYAIFYTDCQENTGTFSLYSPNDVLLLKQHPEKVKALLSQFGTVENLQGIQIYFIYQPKSPEDEERFLLMANFLKKLFEEHHAQVTIAHNLTL